MMITGDRGRSLIPKLKELSKDPKRGKALASLILTLIIISLLLPFTPSRAINVNLVGIESVTITRGTNYIFYIDLAIESSELVPVEEVRITVEGPTSFTSTFSATGGENNYLKVEPLFSIIGGTPYPFGYGYGYGHYYGYGYGYFPNYYGYGYFSTGYGYGYTGPQILRWKVTLYTSQLSTGEYKIKAEVKSNGVWWSSAQQTFSIVAPPPAPSAPPTVESLEAAPPEERARTLEGMSPSDAASIINKMSLDKAVEAVALMKPDAAAERLELIYTDKAAKILENIPVEKSALIALKLSIEKSADVLLTMRVDVATQVIERSASLNVTKTAKRVEVMVKTDPAKTADVVEDLSTETLVELLIEIAALPSTPEIAAKLLDLISLDKAVEVVKDVIKVGKLEELAQIFYHLSTQRLNEIYGALTMDERAALFPYLHPETLARIKPELLPLPDLIPTTIVIEPAEPKAGETFTVDVAVKNVGNVASGAFNLTLKVDDMVVGKGEVKWLNVNETKTLSFSLRLEEAGNYTLTTIVDPENSVDEINEGNNQLTKTITVTPIPPVPKPDLTISSIEVPKEVKQGEEVTVKVIVKNIGEADSGSFIVELLADQQLVGKLTVDGLKAGEEKSLTFTWKPEKAGVYALKGIVDPENAIKELNEENNQLTKIVTVIPVVVPVPKPDLTISSIQAPEEIKAGEEVKVNVVVKNVGKADSGSFSVELSANETVIGKLTVDGLKAGEEKSLTFTWKPEKAGVYALKGIADPDNVVDEANEENNQLTRTVMVAPIVVPWYIAYWWLIAVIVIIIAIIIVAVLVARRRTGGTTK